MTIAALYVQTFGRFLTILMFPVCIESLGQSQFDLLLPSVLNCDSIHEIGHFSITSMTVDTHAKTNWKIPTVPLSDMHLYSQSLNSSSVDKCHVKFLALALKDQSPGFRGTGVGLLSARTDSDKSVTADCYYVTNEKIDFPATLSIAGVCPIPDNHALMWVCSKIGTNDINFSVTLLWKNISHSVSSSNFSNVQNNQNDNVNGIPDDEVERRRVLVDDSEKILSLQSSATVRSLNKRFGVPNESSVLHGRYLDQKERHSVCTVQVFKNKLTSARLFLFVKYYLTMGWTVIVYDRYGLHADVVKEFGDNLQLNYYPFTVFQELFPETYNLQQHMQSSSNQVKYYFEKEAHGQSDLVLSKSELHNQDSDKQKTYDFCRQEFSHVPSMLFVDADELFYCPRAIRSVPDQRAYQKKFMDGNLKSGYAEVHLPRNTYFFRLPRKIETVASVRYRNVEDEEDDDDKGGDGGETDKVEIAQKNLVAVKVKRGNVTITEIMSPYIFINGTELVTNCMLSGYKKRSVAEMLGCWTRQYRHSFYPKHADLRSTCPFHWNHFSCFTSAPHHMFQHGRFMCKCKVNELYRKSFRKIFFGGDDLVEVKRRSPINFLPSLRAYPMWNRLENKKNAPMGENRNEKEEEA